MPVVSHNGIRFHVQELGRQGPPLVMLHGIFPDTLSTWYFTLAPRLARTWRVLLFDLRGHGRSETPPSGYGLHAMAADLLALVDGFADEPVSIVGFSFGAAIALRFAVDRPEGVRRLALVETPLPVTQGEGLRWLFNADAETLLALLPASQREAFAANGRRKQRLVGRAHRLAVTTTFPADLAADDDVADSDLAALHLPVLLCYARSSPLEGTAARLSRMLPAATIVRIEGTHFLPLDAPAALEVEVRRFLDG